MIARIDCSKKVPKINALIGEKMVKSFLTSGLAGGLAVVTDTVVVGAAVLVVVVSSSSYS